MSSEVTEVERRVLAHEHILQALICHLAYDDPEIFVPLKARFAVGHDLGHYQQNHVSTDDYSDHFFRSIHQEIERRKRLDPNGQQAQRRAVPSATDHLLAKKRADGTSQERMVLAVELIADQLQSLLTLMKVSGEDRGNAVAEQANTYSEGAWENEGGSIHEEPKGSVPAEGEMTP